MIVYVIDIKKEGVRDVSILPQIDLEIISKYLLEERSWYTGEKFNAKKSMIFLQVQHSVKGKVLNMLDSFWIWKHYLCTLQLHGWAMVVLLTCGSNFIFYKWKMSIPKHKDSSAKQCRIIHGCTQRSKFRYWPLLLFYCTSILCTTKWIVYYVVISIWK